MNNYKNITNQQILLRLIFKDLMANIDLELPDKKDIDLFGNSIVDEFKKQHNINIGIVINEIESSFSIEITSDLSEPKVPDLMSKLFSIMDDINKNNNFIFARFKRRLLNESFVVIRKLSDTIKVDYPDIMLNLADFGNQTPVSLHDIHKKINCEHLILINASVIKSHVLGLLKIKNLKSITCHETLDWFNIINEYIKGTKDVWKCQDELQDADLDDYAQL